MISPSDSSLIKLQRILTKRLGRELNQAEIEQAYDALMGFAVALVELNNDEPEVKPSTQKTIFTAKLPIADTNCSGIPYYV